MTNSNELVKRLKSHARDFSIEWSLDTQDTIYDEAARRIEALEAELQQLYDATGATREKLNGENVYFTHVIVPVEPSADMLELGAAVLGHPAKWGDTAFMIYQAMIKSAQEQPK